MLERAGCSCEARSECYLACDKEEHIQPYIYQLGVALRRLDLTFSREVS